MGDDDRWTAIQAENNFDEVVEQLIITHKPVFIDGERSRAILISMEEWDSIQEKLISLPA
ncbi:Antitoxin Phd_YefM, type II toxin-antitoxin system [Pseudomonas antarctica]|uniref:Antitoxin Phd_YefM, type II toxin-antitoxin system n=1 Tax=Pseudomonas antarctica TaxID=219572 RepID=A0A1G9Y749_9PSED|nr:type II toxin-antitoxin system Phd/YefM family antitoxin [Pseudomonas antarctica]KAF2410401.1 hypothetical protein PSAN_28320 [Pseudomonas antarctica]SDN04830.1 Antitoxin Phd_YefM, type II toxin-antitoxin system [Pseudomonas antarctica]